MERGKRKFQISPGSQPPPSLCTDEWGKLIRLHRMLPVPLLIPFYQGFASLLLEPVVDGFTEQLRAFLTQGRQQGSSLAFQHFVVQINRPWHFVKLRCEIARPAP